MSLRRLRQTASDLIRPGPAPPPAYSAPAPDSGPQPVPSGTHWATAPLTVVKKDRSLRKNYAVRLSGATSGPDVTLHTSDGDVKADIYLLGRIHRPAVIDVRTTHGSIRLRIHREAGQAVDVRAETTNGRVRIWLPAQFAGIVTGTTKRGRMKLSPALQTMATPHPSSTSAGWATTQAWAITPDGQQAQFPGPDRICAQTKNASIKLYAAGEKDEDAEADDEAWDMIEEAWGEALGIP